MARMRVELNGELLPLFKMQHVLTYIPTSVNLLIEGVHGGEIWRDPGVQGGGGAGWQK